MSLKLYHQKRNFKKTTEPKGSSVLKKTHQLKRLFVIQKHAASHLHYDFRLELNGVLKSWAVPKGPCLDPTVKRLAMHVEDHPIEYASFEGIIPAGQYGGGTVMLWDEGEWICEEEDASAAYKKGDLTFVLDGIKLKGRWKLIRIKRDNKAWLLMKIKDQYAKSLAQYDITIKKPNSVQTKKNLLQIAEDSPNVWGEDESVQEKNKPTLKSRTKVKEKKTSKKNKIIKIHLDLKASPFPKYISPELATLVDKPPTGNQWLHEIKLDGYRLLAFKKNNEVKLVTRNQNDWTNKFKNIANAIKNLPVSNVILDGEIVILDEEHHSNFQLLQNSIKENKDKPFIYYVFDLIYYDQYDLTSLPLIERKNILQDIIQASDDESVQFSEHIVGLGEKVFTNICKMKLEGIISKEINSPYIQKRTKSWLKIKCLKQQEFIIGGFTPPKGNRKYFGALLLGTYNKQKNLIYHGNVGTGFSEKTLKTLHSLFTQYKSTHIPFSVTPPASKNVTWLKPELIAEIEFSDWTNEGYLRHPSFKGLRNDKHPSKITIETETPVTEIKMKSRKSARKLEYKLTHPDKVLYIDQGITKSQLADYYEQIHQWILPYIINRPLTLLRCPGGHKKCFYQKHLKEAAPPGLFKIAIKEKSDIEDYIYIEDEVGLMSLVQMGVLEIHPWGSSINDVEHPNIIVFDLDPAPDVKWRKVTEAAFDIKKQLEELDLKSFVKTTGGKGLHVSLPIQPEYEWNEVKAFAQTLVDFLVMQKPNDYINKMTKARRTGKIYIDYLRNSRGATAIAPYSTRAREHAPVSTPLDWDELSGNRKDTFFTIKTLPNRLAKLKKDPWGNFLKLKQSLNLDKFK